MFQKASRKKVKLRLALCGVSGSGKTRGALEIASGLVPGGKVAVIDTENGSSELYSDRYEFDVCTIQPPYTATKYLEALEAAYTAEYDVVIMDSISHVWAGQGGLLEAKEKLDQQGGNNYTNWGKITPHYNRFMSAILNNKVHLICTMRSKQDYLVQTNSRGKQAPVKVGMAPIQRDGTEYEFDLVFDIAKNHEAETSKDRTCLFDGQSLKLDKTVGEKLRGWIEGTPDNAS